jgi:hypothetical protein
MLRALRLPVMLVTALMACAPTTPDVGQLVITELDSGAVSVRGFLIADRDTVRICGLVLESLPPQCGGEILIVEGADLSTMPGLDTARDVTFSRDLITIEGTINGDVLTVSP